MSKKLLIDARQSDETRVVVLNNNKLEDFDYETSHRKQLKGNIYLARVTRVEPSLQAAFVEYGGNRQGFLAFSEIHPDYYRIPVEDREKLLAEEADRAHEAAAKDGDDVSDDTDTEDNASPKDDATPSSVASEISDDSITEDASAEPSDADGEAEENDDQTNDEQEDSPDAENGDTDEDDARASRRKHSQISRHYKIQEVISRRQILLIQVVKEERGNKGAALTTYLSLAGRYCVLMPNTFHGGGVSRKISNPADRKKLKSIVGGLDVPKGMAVIVRTAGSKRTKAEITRDFNYLTRQWDDIRELTMESSAPSLIHEEGNLIKRSIRDYYSADVDEILVEGSDAHKTAKSHMRNLMPSHVKKVVAYEDENLPLFQRYQVENMLSAMHDPQVTLKSGGYLVINQTEALVAIDVNSGRATKERNIEETALKTNIEAAEEIATQLRQRDLSGLVVIDFIDMENTRNQHTVERKLKDALKNDRARIQISSISQFGLLEMSRQRLRPSLAETVTNICPHCNGTGRIRSVESAALQVLRAIEAEALKGKGEDLNVFMNAEIAIYILNNKRDMVAALEERFSINITLDQDNTLIAPDVRFGDDGEPLSKQQESKDQNRRRRRGKSQQSQKEGGDQDSSQDRASSDDDEDEDKPRRRRRGRRGGRRRRGRDQDTDTQDNADQMQDDQSAEGDETKQDDTDEAPKSRRRRRGRKPQNNEGGKPAQDKDASASDTNEQPSQNKDVTADQSGEEDASSGKAAKKSAKKAAKKSAKKTKAKADNTEIDAGDDTADVKPKAKKAKAKKAKKKAAADKDSTPVKEKASQDGSAETGRESSSSAAVNVVDVSDVKPSAKKKGWWS